MSHGGFYGLGCTLFFAGLNTRYLFGTNFGSALLEVGLISVLFSWLFVCDEARMTIH